jgi:phosphate transport system permease protein
MATSEPSQRSLLGWWRSGEPWIWLTGGAVALSILVVVALLLMISGRGLAHFWPRDLLLVDLTTPAGPERVIGERFDRDHVDLRTYRDLQEAFRLDRLPNGTRTLERWLLKTGNRDNDPPDFRWIYAHHFDAVARPEDLWTLQRTGWGNAYGFLVAVESPDPVLSALPPEAALQAGLQRVARIRADLRYLERNAIGAVNYRLEQLRLADRRLDLARSDRPAVDRSQAHAAIAAERRELQARYGVLEAELRTLYAALDRDQVRLRLQDDREVLLPAASILRAWQPNAMGPAQKLGFFLQRLWAFVAEDPREANTEGGIFPAIFGTVMMVLLMSVLVTPFGVIAAVYLHEYARQGPAVRLVRIAVNNLAGVPSIVYGVFGLGFFVYVLGGSIDALFYPEALPTPTFGTPGILWAALTLALLTVPVVIVSTEEGLSRIPRSTREGSLALGATQAETLWKIILPMASPSIITGVILAIARAAGEVAPLMLVGVVKLAPQLPVDGNAPYLHLDRKFMHLGFHIYDVGFQSPNVEAARPLVYATALLLVAIIVVLNLAAILLRNRLRSRFRTGE